MTNTKIDSKEHMTPEEEATFLKEFLGEPTRFFYGMDLAGIPMEMLADLSQLGQKTVNGMLMFQLDLAERRDKECLLELKQKAIYASEYLKTILARMQKDDKPCLPVFRPRDYFSEGEDIYGYPEGENCWIIGRISEIKRNPNIKDWGEFKGWLVFFERKGKETRKASLTNPTIMKQKDLKFLRRKENETFLKMFKINVLEGLFGNWYKAAMDAI